ncbi:hypothetical protein NDU88_000733 [Pleurodeles waltl]|uniref:Uncharacterized protein n=1 Tax=Pleurodeles waltl TaxID=8319 RepID=A0AAV7NAJ3_PLEWA|nr:hypothetical protein NDU88_000733 [Pleurodeles waltl]
MSRERAYQEAKVTSLPTPMPAALARSERSEGALQREEFTPAEQDTPGLKDKLQAKMFSIREDPVCVCVSCREEGTAWHTACPAEEGRALTYPVSAQQRGGQGPDIPCVCPAERRAPPGIPRVLQRRGHRLAYRVSCREEGTAWHTACPAEEGRARTHPVCAQQRGGHRLAYRVSCREEGRARTHPVCAQQRGVHPLAYRVSSAEEGRARTSAVSAQLRGGWGPDIPCVCPAERRAGPRHTLCVCPSDSRALTYPGSVQQRDGEGWPKHTLPGHRNVLYKVIQACEPCARHRGPSYAMCVSGPGSRPWSGASSAPLLFSEFCTYIEQWRQRP